jgi:VWFA-related protein
LNFLGNGRKIFVRRGCRREKKGRGVEMKKRGVFFLLILAGLLLLALPGVPPGKRIQALQKRNPQQTREIELQHEVTVTLKLIQVYVVDKQGKPVTGLTVDDFEVRDNGQPKKITEFEKHTLVLPEPAAPKPIDKPVAAVQEPPKLTRKFFLLLDYFQNDLAGIKMAKKAALHFLDTQVQPADEVAFLTFSPRKGLTFNQQLTAKHGDIRSAIEKFRFIPYLNDNLGEEGEEREEDEDEENVRLTNQFSEEMREFAKALRSFPGFKNIIFYSGGIARAMLYDRAVAESGGGIVEGGGEAMGGARGRAQTLAPYEEMIKELATSSSSVYTINTKGAKAYLDPDPSTRGVDALKQLSSQTGGKYFSDVVHYKEINPSIQLTTGNYYVLGYYVSESWDGKYHEIDVKVKRKGCEVHAQGGYFSPKPFKEFSAFEKQVHLLDLATRENPSFQVPLKFGAVALPCSDQESSNLVLISEIPADLLKKILGPKSEVHTLVFDPAGSLVSATRADLNFSLLPDKTVYAYAVCSLAPGEYQCRIVLRDLETGFGAVASAPATIRRPEESGAEKLAVFPPLLLLPEKPAVFLRFAGKPEQPGENTANRVESIRQIYRFVSNQHSPLVESIPAEVKKLLAAVLCHIPGPEVPDRKISFTVDLTHKDSGETVHSFPKIISTEKLGSLDAILFSIDLPPLKAGLYTIELTAVDSVMGAESRASRIFLVR